MARKLSLVCALALCVGNAAGTQAAGAQATAAPAAASRSQRGYVSQSFRVRNVDLSTLLGRLERFGLRLPITGRGQVTAAVTVDVPWRHLLTAGEYRFHATIDSADLTLEGINLHDVHAAADYQTGALHLTELRFALWDAENHAAAGTFHGEADVQVTPRGALDARLAVEHLGLATLARRFAGMPPISAGEVSGTLKTHVPLDRVRQWNAWQASGDLNLSEFRVADLPPAQGTAKINLEGGRLAVNLGGMLAQARVAADARVELGGNYPFSLRLRQLSAELADFAPLVRRLGSALSIRGKSTIAGSAQGNLLPLAYRAAGTVRSAELVVDGIRVDALDFDVSTDGEQLAVRRLVARLYRGTATGSATIPLVGTAAGRADLAWRDVQFGSLLGDLVSQAGSGGVGRGQLAVQIPADSLRDPASWQATGTASLDNMQLHGVAVRLAATNFALHDRRLDFSGLRIRTAGGELLAGAWLGLEARLPLAVNFVVRNLELADLDSALPAQVKPLGGRLNARGAAHGDLATRDLSASGTATLENAALRGARLDRAAFGFGLSRHGLHLDGLDARLYGGRVQGTAVAPFSTRVAGRAKLAWDNVGLGRLASDLQLPLEPFTCLASGRLNGTLPAGHNFQLTALSARTRMVVARFTGFGLRDGRLAVAAEIDEGALHVSRLEATSVGTRADGTMRVALDAPFQFSGRVSAAGDLGLLPLRPLLPPGSQVSGEYQLETDLKGTLEPRELFGAGSGSLAAARLDDVTVDALRFQFAADGRTLEVKQLEGQLYGGTLRGSAVLPIAPDEAGQATLTLDGLDAGRLARDLGHLPLKLNAVVNADIRAALPRGAPADPAHWQVDAQLAIPAIHVNSALAGDLHATLHAAANRLEYDARGNLFGGLLTLHGGGQLPVAEHADEPNVAQPNAGRLNTGLVELSGLQLERLSAALAGSRRSSGLSGRVDFNLPFTLPGKWAWPTGSGQLRLSDIRRGGLALADRIVGRVVLQPGRIDLGDASGSFAGGRLRASAAIDLKQFARSTIALAVDNAHSEDLLAAWPGLRGDLTGSVSVQLRGVLSRPWRMAGMLEMADARLMAVAMSDVRLPLNILFEPATAAFQVDVPDGSGQLGHGRMQIRATLRSAAALTVDTQVNLADADIQALLAPAGSLSQLAGGRATGTLKLSGQNVQSLADLSGSLDARLRNVQPAGLPLFRQLTPYLSGGLSGSFDDGVLRARIASGTLLIERLSIASSGAQIYASGRIALSGALDLDVMASDDQLPGGLLGQALLARIPLVAAGPVGWIVIADELLSNRVVYLDVTGTITSPVIQVRPLPMLANEAARFFLGAGL